MDVERGSEQNMELDGKVQLLSTMNLHAGECIVTLVEMERQIAHIKLYHHL